MATTTISDLPRDVLVLILRALLDAPAWDAPAGSRTHDIHRNLRRVSRDWRAAADIAYIQHQGNHVQARLRAMRNRATLRYPGAVHCLSVDCSPAPSVLWTRACGAPATALALASLCASPDLRRALERVVLKFVCCGDDAAAAAAVLAACSHLTSLELGWMSRRHAGGTRPDALAPLSALTGLNELTMVSGGAWPALPDAPALSSLALTGPHSTFAPAGSDASLGRLRRLSLRNSVTRGRDHRWVSDDPFGLRADLGAGAWRPHLLTGLQELHISIVYRADDDDADNYPYHDSDDDPEPLPVSYAPRVYRGATPPAAVWAPLAPTVTKLELDCSASIFYDSDLKTGMYAGVGALTGLRHLTVKSTTEFDAFYPVDFWRVYLPHLTRLAVVDYWGPPIDLARFPRLAHVEAVEITTDTQPLVLSSVAALGRLASLRVSGPRLNLAEMFGGGRPLAALTQLSFEDVTLAWDATAVADAPAASEFAARARALLPSLRSVSIEYVDMDEGVREFVAPALLALGGG